MLAAFVFVLIAGCALGVAFVTLLGLAVKLLFLPFRLLGWLLFIPFLLLKGLLALVTGLVVVPVLALTAVLVGGPWLPPSPFRSCRLPRLRCSSGLS